MNVSDSSKWKADPPGEMGKTLVMNDDPPNDLEAEAPQKQLNPPLEISPRARLIISFLGLFLVCAALYFWDAQMAGELEAANVVTKPPEARADRHNNKYAVENKKNGLSLPETQAPETPDASNGGDKDLTKATIDTSGTGATEFTADKAGTADAGVTEVTGATGDTGECPALCDSRNEARKTKFGGDLLDLSDIQKLAEKGRDKLYVKLRKDYGSYFDKLFFKDEIEPNATKASGMEPVSKDGVSINRMKRRLQIKVLKMMKSLKISDESVHGCNCLTKTGSPTQKAENFTSDIPDYYEKYVFANGGHSNAAGHGNVFSETYTAYLGQDLRMIWDAIGVEMIDRNMAMGAMRSTPDISACSKEIFGMDVDLLSWNYAMTDGSGQSWLYYVTRAAASPSRPVILTLDSNNDKVLGPILEKYGLAFFHLWLGRHSKIGQIPDSNPDGIPLTDAKLNELPPFVRNLYCNRRLEGKDSCKREKWSCTKAVLQRGINCDCPSVPKRTGWHMGYKMHRITATFIAVPFVEMLLDSISELIAMDNDPETILRELEAEDDKDYEAFKAVPVKETFGALKKWEPWVEQHAALGDDFDYWFKGPSICRTSLLPSMTRYLGHAMNSDKVGDTAMCGQETYELGIPFNRAGGVYIYTSNQTPPAGEFSVMSPNDFRSGNGGCMGNCNQIAMADYKDWFMGNWSDGSASLTFPNEKEKEYYGYEPGKFKGILGLVPTLFSETAKGVGHNLDLTIDEYQEHIDLTVNGQPVTKFLKVYDKMVILEGSDGIYWKPSKNNDYVMEFKPKGELGGQPVIERHMRMQGFVLM